MWILKKMLVDAGNETTSSVFCHVCWTTDTKECGTATPLWFQSNKGSIFSPGSVDKTSDRRDRGRVSSCPKDTLTMKEEPGQ
jgi:hypothetical protein